MVKIHYPDGLFNGTCYYLCNHAIGKRPITEMRVAINDVKDVTCHNCLVKMKRMGINVE